MPISMPFSYLEQFCSEQLMLYTPQNYFEVLIFSFAIYQTLSWIQKDRTKHLTLYVYAYSSLLITSHILHAWVLFWTLFLGLPLFAILCVIVHQTQIQKYFALSSQHKLNAQMLPDSAWQEKLIRSLLLAAHHKKNIMCIIERKDSLEHYISAPFLLDITYQDHVLDFLLSAEQLENPTVLIMDQYGIIKYLNITWSNRIHEHILLTDHDDHATQQHNEHVANFLAQTTDAFIFNITATTQQATVWHKNSIIQHVSAQQLLSIFQTFLSAKLSSYESKGAAHAQKNYTNHPTPPQY